MDLPEQRECVPTYSGANDSNFLGPEDSDDVWGADQAEPLSGRIVADRGGSQAPMFAHVEEDVDTHSNRVGCCQIRLEVWDKFPLDWILMVFQDKDDLRGMLEIFNWGVGWEESIPNEEE